jgi:uncharacterized membrane protein YkvA (DUF1232 family)
MRYSEGRLWRKLARYARKAGRQVVEKVLWLYFVLQKPETPAWAKAIIIGALAYFVWPADAVPDVIPAGGYSDDLGVLATAVASVAMYIDADVRGKTREKMNGWFGPPKRSVYFTREEAKAKLGRTVRAITQFQDVDAGTNGCVESIHPAYGRWAVWIRWNRPKHTEPPEGLISKEEYEKYLAEVEDA